MPKYKNKEPINGVKPEVVIYEEFSQVGQLTAEALNRHMHKQVELIMRGEEPEEPFRAIKVLDLLRWRKEE